MNLHHYTFILQLELICFSQCSDNYGFFTAGEEPVFMHRSAQKKKATKECRSFASITTGTLKWSIIYYLTKPNGSNNNKGNEADVQDLPFLSNSCRDGAIATLNPQPDTAWTHAVEHSLMPPYVAACCLFISPLRTMWAWLSDTQKLCPSGLISLDRQDLDQALTSTATAAVSSAQLQIHLQMLLRAQFPRRSWKKQGGREDRKLRRGGLEDDGGRSI